MHGILVAAIVILFATCSTADSTTTLAKVLSPDKVSQRDIQHIGADNTRFLRSGELVDEGMNLDEDSDEERMFANIIKVWQKRVAALVKLPNTRKRLAGYNSVNNQIFTSLKETYGITPQSMYKMLDIGKMIRTVDEMTLLKNENFLMWRKFSEWWGKSATNKVKN